MENTRTIHFPLEMLGCVSVLGNNDIGMTAAIFMNVVDSVIDVGDYLYGAF